MKAGRTDLSARQRQAPCSHIGMLMAIVALSPALRPASAQQPDTIEARRAKLLGGRTAWQADEKLRQKWMSLTGRFIFQRVCLDCHQDGPGTFTREEWQRKLKGFPEDTHPELPAFYSDLTATFRYGQMVPNDAGRLEALTTFLLSATTKGNSHDEHGEVNLFPAVGQVAPIFEIKDAKGSTFQLASLRGKKNLVLVFSRAHW